MNENIWDKEVPVEESSYIWKGKPKIVKRVHDNNPLTVVDLFCGSGGASLGFVGAGFNLILGIDHHEPSMETFLNNHKWTSGIVGDIKDVGEDMINKCIDKVSAKVLIAGVPCQGFSLNNRKRNSNDPRNFLFLEFIRFVEMLSPEFLVLENVSGMHSTSNGSFVKKIEEQIRETGERTKKKYTVEHRMLNAADFGVPQIRKRLIFIAAAEGYKIKWPVPKFGKHGESYRTVKDAIGDLPSLQPGEEKTVYASKPQSEYQKILRKGSVSLFNHKAPNHPPQIVEKIGSTKPGEPIYPKFKQRIRLCWNSQSPTQVAGGIRPQYQFGHPSDARGLSVRERARLQSYPDTYRFFGGTVQGRVQTGNSVPPFLAKAIAEMIREELEVRK